MGTVWAGTSDEYALYAIDLSGDTVRTIRRRIEAEPLSAEHEAWLNGWLANFTEQGFTGGSSVLPTSYPFFERIVAADNGRLWVYREWAGEGVFDVFDRDGGYLGEVRTSLNAGRFGTHPSISGDYLAGVRTDSLDVEYVEVYRIVRD